MPDWIHDAVITVTHGLEIVGAGALILGFVIASAQAIVQIRTRGRATARENYRRALSRVVLIGLEVLVAATILKTVTIEPSPQGLGLLALMIAIRTFLGWTMVLEIDGRWPWQKRPVADNRGAEHP